MHLGYVYYGQDLACVVLYSDSAETAAFISYANPGDTWQNNEKLHAYAPSILVSNPMKQQGFTLKAIRGEERGECQGYFDGGLQIKEKTGIFVDLSSPIALTERRTVAVKANQYSTELPPTDIVPLSRVFDSYEPRKQYFVLLRPTRERKGARISGRSVSKGDMVDVVHCALATIVTGPDAGWTGFILWGGDGGVAIGGPDGVGEPWILLNTDERLPQKVRDDVLVAPRHD